MIIIINYTHACTYTYVHTCTHTHTHTHTHARTHPHTHTHTHAHTNNMQPRLRDKIEYHIAGYLRGVQLSQMSLIYHELVIFTDALFTTLHLTNDI